ncbi:hypothetical protein FWJ25_04670 [Marinobacter salinexigens]|uniref:Sulfotransferase family protein n=1 Tax=Marinobacter salinexigens TaxID=2919747 RepID=A0A5B0VJU3_9GAMM|nr:hypothetical protein [Marinobacter salinexigens]KAA1174688.1 hypothetical protein FWJ25_04670 [Marinobacter salinexigens]
MKRALHFVVHIGTEKTGTTTLQAYLHAHQSRLRQRGICYYASPERIEGRGLAAAALGDQPPDDYLRHEGIHTPEERQAFRRRVVEHFQQSMESLEEHVHTVVISSEHFHSRLRQRDQVEWLKDLVAPWAADTKVVVYLRRQVDVLSSFYSTALRNGEVCNLQELALRVCRPSNHYYNYRTVLELWGEVFGQLSLTPRLFSANDLKDGDILADFLDVLREGHEALPEAPDLPRQNESINPVGQGLMRGLNKVARELPADSEQEELQVLMRKVVSVFSGPGEALPVVEARKLQKEFQQCNAWIRQNWFNEKKPLFLPVTKDNYGRQPSVYTFGSEELETAKAVIDYLAKPGTEGIPWLDDCAGYFRNSAVALEAKDLAAARKLMAMAHRIRPKGPFIQQKLGEYRSLRSGLLGKLGRWVGLGGS